MVAEYAEGTEAATPSKTCYLATDHLGSTRIMMNGSGAVARHDCLPFGKEIWADTAGRDSNFATTDALSQRFTGQQRDGDLTQQAVQMACGGLAWIISFHLM